MDKLLRLVDVSLVTTIASGLLYILGYKYYFYYFTYFGMNLLVRDPEIAYIFSKGFDYSGYLLVTLLLAVIVYVTVNYILVFAQRKIKSLLPQRPTAIVVSLCVFTFAFAGLLEYVRISAVSDASVLAKAKLTQQASVVLQDGSKLSGRFSFFFLNKSNIVLFDTSVVTNEKPRLMIIPTANVRLLEIN